MPLPEEHGGLGVTMSEDVQLAFEFGCTTPAFRAHAELFSDGVRVPAGALIGEEGRGYTTSVGPSAAEIFYSEMVGRATDRAVQVHGGLGYLRTTPVERFQRDARPYRLYEGTSEVQR